MAKSIKVLLALLVIGGIIYYFYLKNKKRKLDKNARDVSNIQLELLDMSNKASDKDAVGALSDEELGSMMKRTQTLLSQLKDLSAQKSKIKNSNFEGDELSDMLKG